jgi:hypothetical protein
MEIGNVDRDEEEKKVGERKDREKPERKGENMYRKEREGGRSLRG